MKIFVLALLLLTLSACVRNNDTLDIYSTTSIVGPLAQANPQILATIGDDQPVPRHIAAHMLAAIGHPQTGEFEPGEMLTLSQAGQIMHRLHPGGQNIYLTDENRHAYISYALWVEMFMQILELQTNHGVQAVNIVPFSAADEQVFTNLGSFGGKRINLTAFFLQEIRILHQNNEILAVIGVTNFTPTLRNAVIFHSDAFGATLTIGGMTRNFLYNADVAPIELDADEITIVNVQIRGQEIIAIYPAQPPAPPNIRVAISTSGFGGLVHESVTITATGAFAVHGGEWYQNFAAGEHFTVSPTENADLWTATRLYIVPDCTSYRLEIVGLRRNWPGGQAPMYRGSFEILRHGNGFVIVNELCLEEYLYSVIPSEMPAAHGLEAAKIQAIAARSFAIHQIYQNRFAEFDAHICDSVISQVYNNIPETEMAMQAVAATRGMVLAIGGQIVTVNYFSTSGGTTANSGEVWAVSGEFPAATPVHLQSQPQFYVSDFSPGNLREEHYAAAFFRNHDIPAIDRQFSWFRWQTGLTAQQLTASINTSIGSRQAANPTMILALDANRQPTNAAVHSIGNLLNMEIISRGQGGNIMEMVLVGTEATVLVRTEFNIRTLLNPGAVPVYRHDGTHISGLRLLPSAFFTMEQELDANGHITAIRIYGGGNGHGVGMSQNGVRTLVERGMCYREILRHYYPNAEITKLAVLKW